MAGRDAYTYNSCVLDERREVIIEVAKNSYKGSFIIEGYFLFFWEPQCILFGFSIYIFRKMYKVIYMCFL